MAEKDDVFAVTGELRDAARNPVAGATIQAVDLDRAAEGRQLGDAVTDAGGLFRINYRRADFTRSMAEALGKAGPWLMVRVVTADAGILTAARARPSAGRTEHYVLTLPETHAPTGPAGRALWFWSERLGDRSIETLADLRAAAIAPIAAPVAVVGGREAQRLAALVALSRYFGPDLAATFEEAGADTLPDLLAWPDARIAGALALSGLTPAEQQSARTRITGLRAATPLPDDSLTFDIGPGILSEADADTLRLGGVLTLEEWRLRRDRLTVAPDARARLDAHVRLMACHADAATARALIAAGIVGAQGLAAADPVALATQTGLDATVLAPIIVAASDRVATIPSRLAASVLHYEEPAPAWIAATQPRSGDMFAGWQAMEPAVAPELSAFRAGRAVIAVPTPAEHRDRRDALLAMLGAAPDSDDPDLGRALGMIRGALEADAAFDGMPDPAAAAAALDRLTGAAFPEGSPARRPALADRPGDAARLVSAWGFDGADWAVPPAPDLPAQPPASLDAAAIGALLDACLGLSLHLRIAALPLLQAQDAAARGDRPAALAALDLLDAAVAVHPWAAPVPAALSPVVSADLRLARLHRGAALTQLLAVGSDPDAMARLEALHGRAAPTPVTMAADLDAISKGGRPAAAAAIARWRKAAFRTKARPRDPAILAEAELHLPDRFDPAEPVLDPAAAQRVLDAWYAGACFRPVAPAMVQLLAVAPRPGSGLSLDTVLTRHAFSAKALRAAVATLEEPVQRWEAAAAGAAAAAAPALRVGYDGWVDDMTAWQAATGETMKLARRAVGAVMIGERLDLLQDAATQAAGGAPPARPVVPRIAAPKAEPAPPPADAPGAQTIRLALSLAERQPVALQDLRSGPGRLLFRTRLRDLQRHLPTAALVRLESARFLLHGVTAMPGPVTALLTLEGDHPTPLLLDVRRREGNRLALSLPRGAEAVLRRASLDLDWCLDLPKAANRLDLATLADVVLELQLTVIPAAARAPAGAVPASGELIVSLARDFPAAWATLADPAAHTASLSIGRDRFPPHLAAMILTDATVQLTGPGAALATGLTLTLQGRGPKGHARLAGGPGPLERGVGGTRHPDAEGKHPWNGLRVMAPDGTWTIALPEDAALRAAIAEGGITDLVLTLGYAGKFPAWPD